MLLHSGTFDVENYGDLLFPLLLRRNFLKESITYISPVGSPPVWTDSVICHPLDYTAGRDLTGIIIGGGNIIHPMSTTLGDYTRSGVDLTAYADLWGCVALAVDESVPVAWNAPGVPGYFEAEFLGFVRRAAQRADYLSVRDDESRSFLLELDSSLDIAVVPDTAWALPNLWPEGTLELTKDTLLKNLCGIADEPYFVVHLNSRYLRDLTPDALVAEIDGIAKTLDARPLLVAIGPCHGDSATALRVAKMLKSRPMTLSQPESILQVAAVISQARAYVGSSMHGFITAAAFGVPAIVIARGKSKFTGVARITSTPETFLTTWRNASDLIASLDLNALSVKFRQAQAQASGKLDTHFSLIAALLSKRSAVGRIDPMRLAQSRIELLSASTRYYQTKNREQLELLRRSEPRLSSGRDYIVEGDGAREGKVVEQLKVNDGVHRVSRLDRFIASVRRANAYRKSKRKR